MSLSDFGPWRTVGDELPPQACRGSARDAAAWIHKNLELPKDLWEWCLERSSRENRELYRLRVEKLRRIADLAHVIRSADFLALLAAEGSKNQRGREECIELPYSSEDGSNRAIGLALSGYRTAFAWVCRPPG